MIMCSDIILAKNIIAVLSEYHTKMLTVLNVCYRLLFFSNALAEEMQTKDVHMK